MNSTVHLIFKTHLDIGFTDYAANVVQRYFQQFIPQALALAQRTRHSTERFRWTTGAWLIYQYLEQASPQDRRAMEAAIEAGDILWHALPFTTHTELMDESLFRFGLSYSQKLDQRFGKTTIAAKMTDVPGHTRAMIPLLAEAGIRLLHIGVNPASSLPDVPPVFLWRDVETGTDIAVIYHATYGGVTSLPNLNDSLAVVLTGDNHGPPSETALHDTYQMAVQAVPDAKILASSLDEFAQKLDTVRDQLPVVTAEIGDTWIHGVGTDPTKMRRYRELCRLRREWLERPLDNEARDRVGQFSHHLIMIPEHTWGMDEKTHLDDYTRYEARDLAALRQTERSRRFEASWEEQRGYIDAALDALEGTSFATEANARLSASEPRLPDLADCVPTGDLKLNTERFEIAFDPQTGAIIHMVDQASGFVWASQTSPLSLLIYEVFGQEDYDRFWGQYIRNPDSDLTRGWARQDFTKQGMTNSHHLEWQPVVTAAYRNSNVRMVFALTLPEESHRFGAPKRLFLDYQFENEGIRVTLSWFEKPACRLPEAFWLSFSPNLEQADAWRFEKIGRLISPLDVVSRGARGLHAIDQRVMYQDETHSFELTTLDAPLVAPGRRSLLDFHDQLPDMRSGVHINLYNNVWGTNFPMWFEDDAVFRFRLRMS